MRARTDAMNRSLLLAVTAIATLAGACDEPAAPNPEPLPETGAVNVIVRDENDALQGAAVYLYPAGEARPIATATTPVNGRVTFDSVPPGDYELRVTGPIGFVPTGREPIGVLRGQHTNVAFTLEPTPPTSPNASLLVRVTDPDGAPVEGIRVRRFLTSATLTSRTDQDGMVYYLYIRPGDYYTELLLDEDWVLADGEPLQKYVGVVVGTTVTTEWRIRRAAD